ncbi:hypothetical protein AMTR_s00040p00220690 [Amborella trichopoda]|uniref:RFTS domain-containing protein n=1 Tax=Amborella trichopoda TaxID=13333 RepID=W1PYX8_AMBTC|nr:hypothetical protein AMTR_s00040p00220690 [Amborella trichopoda]
MGRAYRRLVSFSITNAAAHRVRFDDRSSGSLFISGVVLPFNGPVSNLRFYCASFGPIRSWCITGFHEGTLEIWVSTDIADYLCVNAATEYQSLYRFFYNKAILCIKAAHELDEDPDLEMDTLSNCLTTSFHGELGRFGYDAVVIMVKRHLPFIADQLVGLDRRFSDFQAIEKISEEFKDQVKKYEMLRQMNMMDGWKLSGSFYSIQDYNKENYGECSKSSHERSMTEASSPSTPSSCKKNGSLKSIETYERNLDVNRKALMDPRDIGGKMESKAVSMTRTGDSEAKRSLRTLRGFEILDGREAMQQIEDSESDEFYITSEIWPFNVANSNQVVRCEMFGEITSWCITGYNEGYSFIWVSTRVADYLCEEPNEGYSPFFKVLYEKAMLCILAFHILNNAPYMQYDEFLLKLVLDLMDCLGTFKDEEATRYYVNSQLGFVAEQLIGLDTRFFSKLPVIKIIIDKFNVNIGEACHSFFSIDEKNKGREGMRNLVIHAEEKPRPRELDVNGRKFSDAFYSIHDCNEEFDKEASKDNDGETVMTEATSSKTSLEEEKRPPPKKRSAHINIENQKKNIEKAKKAAMDTRKIKEIIEVGDDEFVAVSMTGTTDIKTTRAQRRLEGFKMLDEGEALQPFEILEYERLYIASEIWPRYNLGESDLGVRCKSFGPAVSLCLTGYEEGVLGIWVSTEMADYLCQKPSADYVPFFKPFYEKAMLCIRAFHIVKAHPDSEFDEFCRKLVLDILPHFDTFKDKETAWNCVNSHLGFVAEQLIGLDWILFSERPSIKSIIKKFNVDEVKALNRMPCGSFPSLDYKNWWIKNCQSEDMYLAEIMKKPEINVPQGCALGPSNSVVKLLQGMKKEEVKRERKNKPSSQLKLGEGLAKEDMAVTKHVCNICRDYRLKKMRQEESMNVEHGRPGEGAMKMEMRKEEAMKMEKGGMNLEPDVIQNELMAVYLTGPNSIKSKYRRLTGFTILDEKQDMHAIEDLEPNKFYISSEIRPVPAANSSAVVRCKLFGPITDWCITGYDGERPFIWVYTKVAVYDCDEPSTVYLPLFRPLYMKAMLCIHASQFLNRNPSGKFSELFEELVLALMAHFEIFKDRKQACTFADSHLGFIVERLIEFNMSFFSKLRAIKTMIDVCTVDTRKASNTVADYPYFLIYRKNEALHKYRSYS